MFVKEFVSVLDEMGMGSMSRMLGDPYQFPVRNMDAVILNVICSDGKGPLFISQNPYELSPNGSINRILAERFFVEFEGKDSTQESLNNILEVYRKWKDFLDAQGIPHVALYSGNKSIHSIVQLETMPFVPGSEVSFMYSRWTRGVAKLLNTDCIDFHCGEPKRLHRIPFSLNVKANRRAVPLTNNMINDSALLWNEIQSPTLHLGDYRLGNGKQISCTEFGKMLPQVNLSSMMNGDFAPVPFSVPNEGFGVVMNNLVIPKCIIAKNMEKNPPHKARVAMVSWLKMIRFGSEDAITFIDNLADFAEWDDRENVDFRHQQVESVMKKDYVFHCPRLFTEGWCVGEKCSLFPDLKKLIESTGNS